MLLPLWPDTPWGLGPQAGARMNPCHSWRASEQRQKPKTWANLKPNHDKNIPRLRKREVTGGDVVRAAGGSAGIDSRVQLKQHGCCTAG